MTTTASPAFGAYADLTITLASQLASATAGRASAAVDQVGTVDAIDCLLGGKITTGTSAAGIIEVWLFGEINGTPEYSGGASGADAALTPIDKSLLIPLTMLPIATGSNVAYRWGPFSVAQAFGGIIPAKWGVWVLNNTTVNLHATAGNHKITYRSVKFEGA